MSEDGSIMPFWAIGGMMTLIAVFWVENTSSIMFDKYKNLSITSAVSRASLININISSSTIDSIVQSSGLVFNSGNFSLSDVITASSIEELDKGIEEGRLSEILSNKTRVFQTVSVPFKGVNESIHVDTDVELSTRDNAVKILRPLNVFVAVESTPENRAYASGISQHLYKAFDRLLDEAPGSRLNIIPYSYRVNYGNRCYTGIARGDSFSYVWWENMFYQEDLLKSYENQLSTAKYNLSSTLSSISNSKQKIELLNEELKSHSPGTEQYTSIQNQISVLSQDVYNKEISIPNLQLKVALAQEQVDRQIENIATLHNTETYKIYFPLAKHYAKRYDNYRYFENYEDEFSNSAPYSNSIDNLLFSAKNITASPTVNYALSVERNAYFGDARSCPSSQVSSDITNLDVFKSKFANVDYSSSDLFAIEGVLWAGRQAYNNSSSLSRNVIIQVISGKKDSIVSNSLTGVNDVCSSIKKTYYNGKVSKIVLISPDRSSAEDYMLTQCGTAWGDDIGIISLDDFDSLHSDAIESKILFYLSQESTSRNVNAYNL